MVSGGSLKRPRPHVNVFGGGGEEDDGGWATGAGGKKAKPPVAAASSLAGVGAAVGGKKKSELEKLMELDAQRKQREDEAAKSKVV